MKKDIFLAAMAALPTTFVVGITGLEITFDPEIQKALLELAKVALAALAVKWGLSKG